MFSKKSLFLLSATQVKLVYNISVHVSGVIHCVEVLSMRLH